MKKMMITLAVFASLNTLAVSPQRIICHDDQRPNKGPLRDVVLTTDENGKYFLQSSYIESFSAPEVIVERWASDQACKLQNTTLAYCQNASGQTTIQIKERRVAYLDSLNVEDKRKLIKAVDISVLENGIEKKAISFNTKDCDLIGHDR